MQVEQGGLAYTFIHPDELRRRLAWGESFTIVDARSEDLYRASGRTIPGAIRLRARDLPDRKVEIPRGRTLVLFTDDDRAESMALGMVADGFTDVYLVEGGFDAWVRAGGATEPARR